MRTVRTEALLLRLTPYGESDAVVQLFTRGYGPVSALARGARKSRRRFGGALDYFCLLSAELRPAKQGLCALHGVDLARSYEVLRSDVERYWAGCQVLEVARLGSREGDADPEFYALVVAALEALDRGADCASLSRVFQARALTVLGYGLSFAACPACGRALAAGAAAVCRVGGGARLTCRPCGEPAARPLSAGAFRTLRAALELPLDRLGTLRVSSVLEGELRAVLEAGLEVALGTLPKSLSSPMPHP